MYDPSLLLAILAPFLLGAAVLRQVGLGAVSDRLAHPGWCYVAGSLGVAAIAFVWLFLDKPIPGPMLAPVVIGLAAVWLWFSRRRQVLPGPGASPAPAVETWIFRVVVALVLVVWGDRVLHGNLVPVVGGDDATIWAAKAKVMFDAQGMDYGDVLKGEYVRHPDYPLLNPLLQVWAFASAGSVLHFGNRVAIQVFGLALILIVASGLRRHVRPGVASVLLVLLFTAGVTQSEVVAARADLMVALGALTFVDGWLRFQRQRCDAWWQLAAIGLGLLLWSKNEGSMLALVLVIAAVVARVAVTGSSLWPSRLPNLLWLLVPAGVVGLTRAFNAHFELTNDLVDPKLAGGVAFHERIMSLFGERIGTVCEHFGAHLFTPDQTRLLVPVFVLVGLLFARRLWRTPVVLPWLFTVGSIAGYMLVFVGTHKPLEWHLLTATSRLCYHSAPVAVLGMAMATAAIWPRTSSGDMT